MIDDGLNSISRSLPPQPAEPTPPSVAIKPFPSSSNQQLVSGDLSQQAGFAVFRLDTLPANFEFSFAEKLSSSSSSEPGVRVAYTNAAKNLFFVVTQRSEKFPLIVRIPRAVVLREAEVNGLFAVAYNPGGMMGPILTWTDGTRWFQIQGNIEIDQMLAIARTMTF